MAAGRLTLVTQLGVGRVENVLPSLITKVNDQRQPVTWLCDPIHSNMLSDSTGSEFPRLCDPVGELRTTVGPRTGRPERGRGYTRAIADDVDERIEDAMVAHAITHRSGTPGSIPIRRRYLVDARVHELRSPRSV